MSKLKEKLFKRIVDAGIKMPGCADDYMIVRHRYARYHLEAGAYRFSMFRTDCGGPTIGSIYTATECARGPINFIHHNGGQYEIAPDSK